MASSRPRRRDGVSATSRRRDAVDAAARESTRLTRVAPHRPTACRETYDGGSTYKGRGNCGVPHYVYGETGKVLTKKDVTGEETDERYAAADQFLLEEGARSSFLTILAHDLMEENKIEMPMNMPQLAVRKSKFNLPSIRGLSWCE